MDTNSSGLETSQNLIILSDEFANDFPTKSFRCNFCKREFSNAQALGGHMNIHRKDRAKLREFSDENLLSLEISKNDWEESIVPSDSSLGEKHSSSVENDRRSRDDDQGETLEPPPRRLQLFEEAPPLSSVNGGVERRKVELKYGEVDLELRLGPEPHHHAKSK